ncbi:unnamed protein product [Bursaphelenchus xylophilus]|uniref:(pine wood nematode) hypothetical protein n=1 Tax=Bursaphelenchus xylophilus TaxID=6326 RepID=A0A1I7RP79_BURXY|nr:unnamed protein product [Bursaphelenchus xylophilus]CAG9095561.1 unnamed protein product [Bursaphelenchus xylophilus]
MGSNTTFKEGLILILRDFAQWTSTHAVPHMAMADKVWIFLFWTVVFIAYLIIMIFFIYTSIVKFLDYPTDLTSRLFSAKQTFPCITICNQNPWKLSNVQGTPLENLVSSFGTLDYGNRSSQLLRHLFRTNGSIGYSFDDLMIRCEFLQEPCNFTDNMNIFYDPYYGRCHTINSGFTWETIRAGPNNGMRIFFRSVANDSLPWMQTNGIVYYVHGTNETPFQDAFGYFAQIGKASSVGVRYIERVKLPEPYNTCVDKETGSSNYYGNNYEVEACIRSCIQDRIMTDCGCYDPQFNFPANTSSVSCYKMANISGSMDCADSIINAIDTEFADDNNTQFTINSCNCPQACNQSYYQISMSQAKWPSKNYTPRSCLTKPVSQYWTTRSECFSWYEKNTLLLEIYFERTSYRSNLEKASYTWVSLIADSGGQLGLWLGMSVLSLFEFAALIYVLGSYFIRKPPMPTLEDYDYWKEFDQQILLDQIYQDNEALFPPKVQEAEPVRPVSNLKEDVAGNPKVSEIVMTSQPVATTVR